MKDREEKGVSLLDIPREYVCFDVETTGLSCEHDEIIEVSAAHVRDGIICDNFSSLVQPPLVNAYNPDSKTWEPEYVSTFITDLTGITNSMLETAPKPDEVFPAFYAFIKDYILVGHNVHFDINFTYDACKQIGLILKNNFVDTRRIARIVFPDQKHYRLRDLVLYCGVTVNPVHRADADVLATIQCLENMRNRVEETQTIEEFIKSAKKKSYNYDKSFKLVIPTVPEPEIDTDNPMYQKSVVFTGAMSNMTRREAFQVVKNLGGIPQEKLNENTNFLVVGNGRIRSFDPDDEDKKNKDAQKTKSKKIQTAEKYQRDGIPIIIMSEDAFFKIIGF